MIRFIGNDDMGLPLKRKQHRRACDVCRRRKKRCPHQDIDEQVQTNTSRPAAAISRGSVAHSDTFSPVGRPFPDAQAQQCRPESSSASTLIQSQTHNTGAAIVAIGAAHDADIVIAPPVSDQAEEEDHDPRFTGELNPEGIFIANTSPAGAIAATPINSLEDVVGIWVPRKIAKAARTHSGRLLPLVLPYIQDECSKILPGAREYGILHHLYTTEIHPILPIVNLNSYQKYSQQQQHRETLPFLLLKLTISLSVASNPKAASQLPLPPKEFTAQSSHLLQTAIDNHLVKHDKQLIIQILLILSLATQLSDSDSNSDDRHNSAELACRAVSYVHTGGIHLDTSSRSNDSPYLTTLFCCVYAVDRLNAAIQGRPVLMHERDFGRELESCVKQQDGLFQLLLRVVMLLDSVIALYRPGANFDDGSSGAEEKNRRLDLSFPLFEDLLGQCGVIRAPASQVATIETFYHAVAMLSCRSQSLHQVSRTSSAAQTRQNLAAASVITITGSEYKGQLSVLPFVPYAMSLALRVLYRELRLNKSSFTRARARRQLLHVCMLLRGLGDVFSSSLQMADMAERTVQEMDKAYLTVTGQQRSSTAAVAAEGDASTSQQIPAQDVRQDVQFAWTSSNIPEGSSANSGMQGQEDCGMISCDLALPEFDLEFDIFEHFDPEFDIAAVDAALANDCDNLLPHTWTFGHPAVDEW